MQASPAGRMRPIRWPVPVRARVPLINRQGITSMRSTQHRGLITLLIMLCTGWALTGCASAPPIIATRAACHTLLPTEWQSGVPGAPLPEGRTVGDWIAFGDAQTGQLDKANGRYADAIGIIERCEARDREAVQAERPKLLGLF